MWETIRNVHVQQVPGMRFSAYNDLFSIVKHPEQTFPAIASRVEEAIARIVKICSATVTEISARRGGRSVQTTRDYAIGDLDNELALMAMLCALPCELSRCSCGRRISRAPALRP
jgi:hypothetical protein